METQILKSAKNRVKHWYLSFILGILFIFVGIVVILTPFESYITLSTLFSVIFFISGVFGIIYSVVNRKCIDNWGWGLFSGIIDLIFGLILILNPPFAVIALPIFVGFMLMFSSMNSMAISFDLKSFRVKGWGWLLALGILGTLLSVVMILNPEIGSITVVTWTSLTFITIGIFKIVLSFELKRIKDFSRKIKENIHELRQDLNS